MSKTKLSDAEQVSAYMQKLEHPLKDTIQALRQVILDTDTEISEQIKWNSPAFYYTGEMAPFDPKEYKRDIIVLHLRKDDHILLIFPTGAKVNDTTGLLEGNFTDGRKMARITCTDDLQNKKQALQGVIKQWLKQVEK